MTYCLGMLVRDGLVMISDTRTNAGMDNVSVYRKLHVFETPGERTIAVATSGNLSMTQTALSFAGEGMTNPDTGQIERLQTAPSLIKAAELIGHAVRKVRADLPTSLKEYGVSTEVGFLIGGRVGDEPIRLFLVYSAGNFIECEPDTPFLQIGEIKYGKPILDRVLERDTAIPDALKLGLLSMDATLRSNVAVGLPMDLLVLREGAPAPATQTRIEEDDPYFSQLGRAWHAALTETYRLLPRPPYV